jgi:N-acetylglucosamine-6-phosphate deacetylase
LAPGFVDIHCHGGNGIDAMSASPKELADLMAFFDGEGYEGVLLTTVTAPASDVVAAFRRWQDLPGVLGFHLEGPFISPGFPGAQPQEFIAALPPGPEWEPILNHPKLRVVTLAPEIPGGLDLTTRLAGRDVRVSIGHTSATCVECQQAVDAGARHMTHAFNAMRPLHHREIGCVGFALSQDTGLEYCELIYDRVHVSQPAAKLLIENRTPSGVIGISDGTAAAGLAPGTCLSMWGLACRVEPGAVYLEGTQTLAGSAVTLRQVFANLMQDFGPAAAIEMCCLNPRRTLGMGEPNRWIILDDDGTIVESYTIR